MSDHQLSYLSAYFQGKFNFHDTFWDGFPISVTIGRNLTETENAQNSLKLILQINSRNSTLICNATDTIFTTHALTSLGRNHEICVTLVVIISQYSEISTFQK